MTTSVSVPHHRVEASTHSAARDLAAISGVSLSQVAETGLRRYVEQHPSVTVSGQSVSAPALPTHVIDALVSMREIGDAQLDGALSALHRAGWSYATLAKPIGMTRQAVHLRVSKAAPGWPLNSSVPEGPSRGSRGSQSRSTRFDWAVWVDKATYAQAVATAKQRGDVMRDVMESILSDYVSGAFAVSAADVHPATSNEKKANTR